MNEKHLWNSRYLLVKNCAGQLRVRIWVIYFFIAKRPHSDPLVWVPDLQNGQMIQSLNRPSGIGNQYCNSCNGPSISHRIRDASGHWKANVPTFEVCSNRDTGTRDCEIWSGLNPYKVSIGPPSLWTTWLAVPRFTMQHCFLFRGWI